MNVDDASQAASAAAAPLAPAGLPSPALILVAGLIVALFIACRLHRFNRRSASAQAVGPATALSLLLAMMVMGWLGASAARAAGGIQMHVDRAQGDSLHLASPSLTIEQHAQLALGLYGGQLPVLIAYLWLRRRTGPPAAASLRAVAPATGLHNGAESNQSSAAPHLQDDPRPALDDSGAASQSQRRSLAAVSPIGATAPLGRPPMTRLQSAAVGAVALALSWPVVIACAGLAAWLERSPVRTIAHETLRQMATAQSGGWFITLLVLVVVAAPLMEELLYRGLFQRAAISLGIGRWSAIIITSVLFALMHIGAAEPHALAGLLTLGLALGWACERTGRLTAPVVMHVLFNLGNLMMARSIGG